MLSLIDSLVIKSSKDSTPKMLPKDIWVIVLMYTHDYLYDMVKFCHNLGWRSCVVPLQLAHNHGSTQCAEQTQLLQERANLTKASIDEATDTIRRLTAGIQNTNSQLIAITIAQNEAAAEQEIAQGTNRLRGQLELIQQQINHFELNVNTKLKQQNGEALLQASLSLEATLDSESSTGAIAAEKIKRAQAQHTLELLQKQLNGSAFSQEVQQLIQLLRLFSLSIDTEINRKGPWCNRIRMKSNEEWGFGVSTSGRICGEIGPMLAGALFWGFIGAAATFLFYFLAHWLL
ncbi:MAG: hypothetical protein H0U75_01800 [Legionella sp.]|nr:hypothetical protein [Legionella sp.]